MRMIRYLFLTTMVVGSATVRAGSTLPSKCNVALELSFEKLDQMDAVARRDGYRYQASEKETTFFWNETWPYLQKLAADNDMTASELLAEYASIAELVESEVTTPKEAAATHEYLTNALRSVKGLESLPHGKKLKSADWDQVRIVQGAIMSFGRFATKLEKVWREKPSLNPFLPVTPARIQAIFESYDNSALDHAIGLIETYKSQTASEPSADTLSQSPAATSSPSEDLAAVALRDPTDLAAALLLRAPLRADLVYEAVTLYKQSLRVKISEDLVKESTGRHAQQFHRLMNTIFTGRGDKSGLRPLKDVGPQIVELTGQKVGGHWRIFGCFDGLTLVLKKMVDIGESRSAYSRAIPSTFCAP